MKENVALRLTPCEAADMSVITSQAARALGLKPDKVRDLRIIRKSIDARKRDIVVNLTICVAWGDDDSALPQREVVEFKHVAADAPQVVIVGAGPAGLFAALRALQHGMRPILLERGRDVDTRRVDIAQLSRTGNVDPESNYCFGEGGAGTFSDGKLYTRSKKRGDNDAVMQLLVQFGAKEEILSDSHPHIGSDRLPKIIKAIREKIIECGGEVRFSTRADELILTTDADGQRRAIGVVTSSGETIKGDVILATGHSARDTIRRLHAQGVEMEAKGFAMGVRLEHPSELIDRLQYHSPEGRGEYLPAAEYNYVTQVDGRGVYSFCMCPGGVVVPAMSAPGEGVVIGAQRPMEQLRNGGGDTSRRLSRICLTRSLRTHGIARGCREEILRSSRTHPQGARSADDRLCAWPRLIITATIVISPRPARSASRPSAPPCNSPTSSGGIPRFWPQIGRIPHRCSHRNRSGEPHILPRQIASRPRDIMPCRHTRTLSRRRRSRICRRHSLSRHRWAPLCRCNCKCAKKIVNLLDLYLPVNSGTSQAARQGAVWRRMRRLKGAGRQNLTTRERITHTDECNIEYRDQFADMLRGGQCRRNDRLPYRV